jgi:hypothetical protein
MPFLTEVDDRAAVKGSRDPLGVVPIWSRFGREVVGNLTTVTNNVRGFTTLLLGLYFAEEVQQAERDATLSILDLFLKFEQIAGYARVRHNSDRSVRGLRRISARLSERKRMSISVDAADQILSNQKVYGLWGLFSMPGRASELLLAREQRLSARARDFVERTYLPLLPNGRASRSRFVIDLLRKENCTFDVDGDLGQALARMHAKRLNAREKEFYRDHLAWGGEVDTTAFRQQQLAEILKTIETEKFEFDEFDMVRNRAKKSKLEELSASLERINALEHLLTPARVVFGYLLTQTNEKIDAISARIAKEWRRPPRVDLAAIATLRESIATSAGGVEYGNRWLSIAELIVSGDYDALVRRLVELNTRVMQARNGSAAWVAIESDRLRVLAADETEELLSASAVERLWRSTYFINSLWNVSREVS